MCGHHASVCKVMSVCYRGREGRREEERREEGEGRGEVGRKEDHGSYRLSHDCQFYLMPPEALIKHLIITIYGLG